MPVMGESRQELLAWLNNLLQLNVTKVEQCGTGAALCQIFDSIFLDVPMARVKFDAKTEYAYLNNFKILQNTFQKHQIDRPVPVEALVKCKMQDNLEFLQWTKRYWDQYFPGVEYDPLARRKSAPGPSGSGIGGGGGGGVSQFSHSRTSNTGAAPSAAAARRPMAPAAAPAGRAAPRAGGANSSAASAALVQENTALKEMVTGLERERDFYFNKLREIEVLVQAEVEGNPELEKDDQGFIARTQAILYSTEEGFEIPADGEDGGEGGELIEEETF